jgi:hypothetical protein
MLEIKEILRLWVLGVGKKRTAALLGLDVKTVRRYLSVAQECGLRRGKGVGQLGDELVATVVGKLQSAPGRAHGDVWARCEQDRGVVEQYLKEGIRLTKIRKLLAA